MELNWLDDIFASMQDSDPSQPEAMAAMLRGLIEQDKDCTHLTVDRFLKCHTMIRSLLDKKPDNSEDNQYEILTKRLLHKVDDGLLVKLQQRPVHIEMAHVYKIALNEDRIDSSALTEKLGQELSGCLTKDDWLQQLRAEDFMLEVLLALLGKGKSPNLDHKYVDALISHAKLVQDGTEQMKFLGPDWPELLDALSEDERIQFRHELVSQIIADGHKPLTPLLSIYKAELAMAMTCSDVPRNEQHLRQALVNLAGQDCLEQRKWLILLFAKQPNLIDKTTKSTKNNLRDRLRDFLNQEYASSVGEDQRDDGSDDADGREADNDWADAVQKVVAQLDIKLPQKPKRTQGSDDSASDKK